MARVRPYLFYDTATSICPECFRRVDGKIVFQDEKVLLLRRCPVHGPSRTLIADDIAYYKRCREVYLKAPEQPLRYNTPIQYGCPYDCGLCPDHEQHSCLSIVEITDHCNLRCPTCYANSGPERKSYRSLEEIEAMLDAVVANEGEPDVVQISGGEPTLHPDFFAILDAARKRPIRHLMVNTNGVRIATEDGFAERLAEYMPGFELYLQFDSLEEAPLRRLRDADMRSVHEKALERLNALNLSTTLVVTLQKGLNDQEVGRLIEYGTQQRCVRGVTFQPIQHAGRTDDFNPATDRLTLTEVRRAILEQSEIFSPEDIIPVPCHPDSLAMGYALKIDDKLVPLSGLVPTEVLLASERNTIVFERDPALKDQVFQLFATNHSPESTARALGDLLCCLPQLESKEDIRYENVFRVLIMAFIDAWSFDLRSVKKSCVHFVTPQGHLVPFDTYNLFYRDNLAETRLQPLREEIARALPASTVPGNQ